MNFRKIFFWIHLSMGSITGAVILIMSLSGAFLAYQKQITAAAERAYRIVTVVPRTARLSPEEILIKLKESSGATSIAWHSDPSSTVELSFGREHTLFINPYTGEALGEGATRVRSFFRVVENWHRWLAAGVSNRAVGRGLTGACNFAFLFMVCTGIYLWLPRTWSWPTVKTVLFFRGGLRGKARDYNWHNVLGLWCCVPLSVVVACAVVMSYPWVNNLIYRLSGTEPPKTPLAAPASTPGQVPNGDGAMAAKINVENLSALCALAEQKTENWQTISLRLPRASDATVTFSIDAGNGGQPDKKAQLTLNRKSKEEVRWETFENTSRGRRWRTWIRFLHTGEVFGLFGQTIAGLAALGGAFLVYTGFSLALRRLIAWRSLRPGR